MAMNVLTLEPYYGGSHKAFLDGWKKVSRHTFSLVSLEPYKWKWRMRHSAVTFSACVEDRLESGEDWDIIFCSDMLNLAEFLGLAPPGIRSLPVVAYFHENQLTYPVRFESERDYQFAMTNMTTALAADEVWFNSAFHRDSFLGALEVFLKRMPDNQPFDAIERISLKSRIQSPGVEKIEITKKPRTGPIRILWAARWEHDKNPEEFFEALKILKQRQIDFRLSVIGESFRDRPEVFDWAKDFFAGQIDRWGYQEAQSDYYAALAEADVIVSTADHEFFGISVVEAILAGVCPVLPKRLAYPEILGLAENQGAGEFFYENGAAGLATKLIELAQSESLNNASDIVERFEWSKRATEMDDALESLA
jgi:glycosyltransferase involved in cell wall biosynthesis